MPKHRLSPVPLPPAKRQHKSIEQKLTSNPLLNFDSSLYDELVLVIFSYLSWTDLCAIQSTNRHWARLVTDNQLWKEQYVRRCELERFSEPGISEQSFETVLSSCALLAGPITITTSSEQSLSPPVYLHRHGSAPYILKGKHRMNMPTHITTLSLDQSPPSLGDAKLRVAAFYDTGEFTIFLVDHSLPQHSQRSMSYIPFAKTDRTSPIRQAVYHHPLLVTLSHSFHLSLYNLSGDTIYHSQTLTSFTSFPPTSMVLTPGPSSYRLVLAFSAPVYPAHWNAAVVVLTISSCEPASSSAPLFNRDTEASETSRPCSVIATRSVRSYDVPSGWIDERALRTMREQWGRKVARVADTQTDGKWIVLAPADQLPLPPSHSTHSSVGTTSCALQLYRLYLPSPSSTATGSGSKLNATHSPGGVRMTFVRMLHGHTGPVIALAVADGRCVSLGADGSLWVWDLEKGWGVEVQEPHRPVRVGPYTSEYVGADDDDEDIGNRREVPMDTPLGTVVFDERRIVTTNAYGIEARRFDI
ncbi:hypothetical protein EW145_g2893 [Phellinidium pouzarii]|uniref:F-box domain-containing protein n=1 Tax=Phellinidium pouzarii TaxID=167371 RepID=A0A4S4L9C5_9AGAM|nr:hypothetical protein EW145_g2893 [Phellinidium pouzarii]